MAAVAEVVDVFIAGASAIGATGQSLWGHGAAVLAGGGATLGAGVAVGAAMAGGSTGSVASQVVGRQLGVVDHFSLRGAAASGIAVGLTAGLGATGVVGRVADGIREGSRFTQGAVSVVAANATSAAVNTLVGAGTHFSWRNVAAFAVSAGLSALAVRAVGSRLAIDRTTSAGQAADVLGWRQWITQ